jgi:hypothetical protein
VAQLLRLFAKDVTLSAVSCMHWLGVPFYTKKYK